MFDVSAQDYTTNFTTVLSSNPKNYVEISAFFHTDTTWEVIGPQIMQKFELVYTIYPALFIIKDVNGKYASIGFYAITEKRRWKKPRINKFISLIYDKHYLFYSEIPYNTKNHN